jgi:hypothetical protein
MGCDIHCWIEYRESGKPWVFQRRSPCGYCKTTGKLEARPDQNSSKRSKRKGKWEECFMCDGEGYTELHTEDDSYQDKDGKTVSVSYLAGGKAYRERNYVVFSLLAGVRDYEGHPEPLFEPRGVPDDATVEYAEIVEQDGADGHSHSWLTLSEIEAGVMCAADPLDTDPKQTEMLVTELRGEFWDGLVVGQMRPLAEKYGSDNVRIVFHFDN